MGPVGSYGFRFEILLESKLALMKPAELVDLVLVLTPDFDLVSRGLLVLSCQLG